MDYEKKYNEALERARFYHGNCPSEPERKKLEGMFPVLRESEDERIRKAIIRSIEEDSSVYEQEVSKEQMLAWLEKQKEPTKEELYAEAGTTENEYIANTMKMVRAMREKQKEQKPSWKPSEEHLSALLAVFNDPNNIGSQTCQLALADLYEQLKKL